MAFILFSLFPYIWIIIIQMIVNKVTTNKTKK